ncbi:MAG TPA: 1-acyl-sn-glycerol-3-phosphate acyltransferase [Candidatus Marinimicrobia bacterium]|nr:1-acyl-sn-glycerol-3-phosphate acyltransferase [Candidatus Neomarinimicrobiota bacterium]
MIRLLTFIRSVWAVANLLLTTFFYAIISLLLLPFPFKHAVFNKILKVWARWNLFVSGISVRVNGLENIEDRPYIIVSNHESALDIFAIYARLPLNFRMVAKKEMEKLPLVGFIMKKYLFPLVNRYETDEAIETMNSTFIRLRQNNLSVCIFPEGTRHGGKQILPFKKGAFVLSLNYDLPLLPVVLRGSGDVTPTGSLWVKPGKVYLDVLPPFIPCDKTVIDRNELLYQIESQYRKFLKEKKYLP